MNPHHPEQHLDQFLQQVKDRSDRMMNVFLGGFFIIGALLAPVYDTWLVGLGVGALSLAAYYSAKIFLPRSTTYQYVLSLVMGIFMAQYIYQMHGLFEMHFFAFIGSAMLVTYQDWRLQIPLAIVVIVHHAVFGYLQYRGVEGVYFTQLDYMPLQTFLIHGFLATVIFAICGLWAHNFHVSSQQYLQQSFEIGKLQEAHQQKEALLQERKRAEAEREKAHSLIEATLESTADGILVTDHRGRIVLFNKKFAQLWGVQEEALAHMDEDQLLSAVLHRLADPGDFLFKIKKLYLEPQAVSEDILKFQDGTVLERVSLPQMIQGDCVGRVWNFRDVTARRQAEELLEQQNRELVKTNAELDRFVYSASHELRAPLTSVLGLISIARMGENDAAKTQILDLMETSVQRLDIFIRDIVNYSSNTRMDLSHERIDFEEMVHDCIEQLRYMPEVERVSIFTEVHGECDFYSDKRRLTVVLNNLLSNAIKYQDTDQEKPYIHVTVLLQPDQARITISDNGAGIAEPYQDKIFNMFYRATERKSGTGLGLYIVKEIVNRLSGKVSVESQPGKGSTFYVSIPSSNAS